MTTVLPFSCLLGRHPAALQLAGAHWGERISGQTPQDAQDRGIIPTKAELSCVGSPVDRKLSQPEGARPRKGPKWLAIIGRLIYAAIVFSVAAVLCWRWFPPPTSAFMVKRYVEKLVNGEKNTAIRYRWVDEESISPQMALAVIAAEDQMFPVHWGLDFEAINDAVERSKRGGRLRGASTITQQLAKNLFLWSGRSYVRKGLEAYFALLLELLWSKHRILEVYLNVVEFGDGIYGVSAAAETLLGKTPAKLTSSDAALLAAVLPNPKRFRVRNPSSYVRQRQYWIRQQMEQLGGIAFLKEL